METFRDIFSAFADFLANSIGLMVDRLFTESSYREGFGACLVILVVGGFLLGRLNYAWAQVLKFFSATKAPPSPAAGPTPIALTGGCALGGVTLLGILLLLAWLAVSAMAD